MTNIPHLRPTTREQVHHYFFLFSIAILVVGIPFSRFLMSLGGMLLTANWVAEGKYKEKWNAIVHNKALLVFLLLYGVHIVWLIYTFDINIGLQEMLVKIPLLYLPVIFASSQKINDKELSTLLKVYLYAMVMSIVWGWLTYKIKHLPDKRNMALYISYARFAINICFSFVVAIYIAKNTDKWKQYFYIALAIFFCFSLAYAGSLTALILVIAISIICGIKWAVESSNKMAKISAIGCLLAICIFIFAWIGIKTYQYFHVDFDPQTAETSTAYGHPYTHNYSDKDIENGSYIYTYVCEEELAESWQQRSKIDFYGNDTNGFPIENTLIRYLNSMGLHKDKDGMVALTNTDIKNIENGIGNYHYTNRIGFVGRFYSTLWEINSYLSTGYAKGHSMPQRFELWKTSCQVIKEHLFFGVGTGGARHALKQKMIQNNSQLQHSDMKSHNQYLSFLVSFGVIGFLICMIAIFYPVIVQHNLPNLFKIFFIIVLIAMITEDFLGQQDGATMFAFFYSLFLFLKKE